MVSVWGAIFVFLLLIILHKNYSYKIEPFFGVFSPLLFIFIGLTLYSLHNTHPMFHPKGISLGVILEKPQEKQNSYKSLVRITSVHDKQATFSTDETVLVYFEKSEKVKSLQAGNQILLKSIPQEIMNFGSPYSFNYKSYLENKKIYRQVFLSCENWKSTNLQTKTLPIRAELLREKLLTIYRNQRIKVDETKILSALTLGYKRDLDPETKRIFSAAGAMHVLAVSGLHVAILFLVFSRVFSFLKRHITGRIIFILAAVLLLWTYAFITGLTPSVLRASTMFSLVIIGGNMNRKANIYNSLVASALFLLLLNPNNLFEVGFQLSYSAVFGIVFLQPKFARLWTPGHKILTFFWNLLCVSVAAQISTSPLLAFYFNQFPVYFWASNLIVIPVVTVLIPLGISLLILAKVPILSMAVSFIIQGLIKSTYNILKSIEALPHSVLEISLHPIELVFYIAFLIFTFVFIKNTKASSLKMALSTLLLWLIAIFGHNFYQQKSHEMIIYYNASNMTMQLINGRQNYVISEHSIEAGTVLMSEIQDVKRKKRLAYPVFLSTKDAYEDDFLFCKNGIFYFNGKTIYLTTDNVHLNFSPDYLITSRHFKIEDQNLTSKTRIICHDFVHSSQLMANIHSLKTDGVFCDKW